MNTLYIHLHSIPVVEDTQDWLGYAYPFALVSSAGYIEREGIALLSSLSETIARMQHLVLLLSGSNVTVLRVKVPPLSASRLKAVLPGLVEEHLLGDPSECVIVAGGLTDGLRTIAVVQRDWLASILKVFLALGARKVVALPAQLCLSCQTGQPGSVTAAINEWDTGIDITLRLSEQDGIGLSVGPVHSRPEEIGRDELAANMAIQTLCAVVPDAPVTLYVPQSVLPAYRKAINELNSVNKRIEVVADSWPHWVAGADAVKLDLVVGLGAISGPELNWRPWRWPLALAAVVFLGNAAMLNVDWWHMKSEANRLRTSVLQMYKSAYPKETVIIDPVAQMQQKIAAAQRNSGIAAADDFTALTAAFGEAWASVMPTAGKGYAIAALEYRERSLLVRFKPMNEVSGGDTPLQPMKGALEKHKLALDLAPEQSGSVVWQLRSMK